MNEPEAFIVLPLAAMRAAVDSIVRAAFDDALADRIAEVIGARLGAVADAETYSSSKLGPHIPGKSRRWMVRNLRAIPGARKVGRDWHVTRVDFDRWSSEQDVQVCRAATAQVPTNARSIALGALAKAGLRATNTG